MSNRVDSHGRLTGLKLLGHLTLSKPMEIDSDAGICERVKIAGPFNPFNANGYVLRYKPTFLVVKELHSPGNLTLSLPRKIYLDMFLSNMAVKGLR